MASEEWNFNFLTQMDPFWNNIYDDDKDKRYGGLFLAILLIFFLGLPLLVALFAAASEMFSDFMDFLTGYPEMSEYQAICACLLTALVLVALVLFGRRWVRIGRTIRKERSKYSNLSRDELFKARSKLKNRMNPVKFRAVERPAKRQAPTPRRPDTDLKY
jgi:hypothetical protein